MHWRLIILFVILGCGANNPQSSRTTPSQDAPSPNGTDGGTVDGYIQTLVSLNPLSDQINSEFYRAVRHWNSDFINPVFVQSIIDNTAFSISQVTFLLNQVPPDPGIAQINQLLIDSWTQMFLALSNWSGAIDVLVFNFGNQQGQIAQIRSRLSDNRIISNQQLLDINQILLSSWLQLFAGQFDWAGTPDTPRTPEMREANRRLNEARRLTQLFFNRLSSLRAPLPDISFPLQERPPIPPP
ncbi:MAG: hypothetical protein O7G87_06440 [bacterium]|nr:hypothetical protein [bacterium]